jgi:hypothetical protein
MDARWGGGIGAFLSALSPGLSRALPYLIIKRNPAESGLTIHGKKPEKFSCSGGDYDGICC